MLKKYFKIFLTGLLFVSFLSFGPTPPTRAASDDFTLIWSSDSYVPFRYEGLPLPTRGSQIKAFVLPTKSTIKNPEKLNYRWLIDEEVAGWASGVGKSALSFQATKWLGDYHKIEAQVLDKEEKIAWRKTVNIKISSAEVVFSLPDSFYSAKEIVSTKTGQTLKITALPFFFNTKSPSADLSFKWKLNEQELASTDNKDPDVFLLTVPAGQIKNTLLKNLRLTVSDKKDASEQASSKVIIEIKQ